MTQLYAYKHYVTDKADFRIDETGARWGDTPNIAIDAGTEKAAALIANAFKALHTIAATSLWGEYIPNSDVREELRGEGLYNDDEGYQPSSDDESTLLRDAVEAARGALGLPLSMDEKYIVKNRCAVPGGDGVNQYRTYSAAWHLCRQINLTPEQAKALNLISVSPMQLFSATNGEM